jgi:hypothetical protein
VASFAFIPGGLKPGFTLEASESDYPGEYGTVFRASKKGRIYALGFNVPDTGVYVVSLWDAASQSLLLRDTVHYTAASGFLYADFGPRNKELDIDAGRSYIASVYLPRLPKGMARRYYHLFQLGVYHWVPFTQGHITVTGCNFTFTNAPTFPDVPVYHDDVMVGLADIGYYATAY